MSNVCPVQSITLVRREGPTRECNRPVTITAWSDANFILRGWSDSVTAGYDKVDFAVKWGDSVQYQGRYDLVHWKDWLPDLAAHIRSTAYFYTGRRKPAHMTDERYLAHLRLAVKTHPEPQFQIEP
ncbi:hypothetical protein [Cupriavidus metallidurans]|uniref:hypothetical protein n=1 Tax=Cupriavidus metallidurans TaxID=119219 RepID=UPI001F451CD5|nr:hypothetical protein [Cupriavidus metallidurans]